MNIDEDNERMILLASEYMAECRQTQQKLEMERVRLCAGLFLNPGDALKTVEDAAHRTKGHSDGEDGFLWRLHTQPNRVSTLAGNRLGWQKMEDRAEARVKLRSLVDNLRRSFAEERLYQRFSAMVEDGKLLRNVSRKQVGFQKEANRRNMHGAMFARMWIRGAEPVEVRQAPVPQDGRPRSSPRDDEAASTRPGPGTPAVVVQAAAHGDQAPSDKAPAQGDDAAGDRGAAPVVSVAEAGERQAHPDAGWWKPQAEPLPSAADKDWLYEDLRKGRAALRTDEKEQEQGRPKDPADARY